MKLDLLLPELLARETSGNLGAVEIAYLRCDSRKVAPGDLFVAVKCAYYDGHQHIADAIARGAAAVLVSDRPVEPLPVPWIRTHNTAEVLGPACAFVLAHPSRQMDLVGVTGTNGKTTTASMIECIQVAAGRSAGFIGTTGVRYAGASAKTGLTTPEAPELQELLAQMVKAGVTAAAMEVSSHGIALRRVHGTSFSVGVLTGIGRDHLDFHGDQTAYQDAKINWLLEVAHSPKHKGVIVPQDDDAGREVLREFRGNILSFGMDDDADIYPRALELTPTGTTGRINTPEGVLTLDLRVPGRHNVRNAMAAVGAAQLMGIEPIAIVEGFQRFRGVPGRYEPVKNQRGITVLVDYAHTPDALQAATGSLRELTKGRIITIFGCGGDRDRQKRPEMGRIVYETSDMMVITSDNPRTESPHAIIEDILMGIPVDAEAERVHVEPDRRQAIALGISLAEAGDVVLIAGKGHETVQILASGTIDFDDRAVAAEVLAE